jgi:hypothetical protein
MAVFFNGRLLISPTTASVVDDSAMNNRGLSVGNIVALLGRSEGGQPNTALRFGSPSEAVAMLRSGELLDAVLKAFDPSSETGGPATVVALRVNPAVQASLMLKDGSAANVIQVKSTDYGLYTNQIKVKVEAATTKGRKLTTQLGNSYYSEDNIFRDALQIQYTGGQASGVIDVTGTTFVLEAPTGTTIATIDLNSYPTIQQLVDRINAETGWVASVLDGNGAKPALNGLDYLTNQDVKTAAYSVAANLQACVDWFNGSSEGYLTATRQAGVGAVPTALAFTYLSGGSDGTVTNTEWSNAYTVLQGEDVQWVVPISSDSAIHAMNDAHCAYMSNVARMERRGIVGSALATADSAAITAAKALNSDRTSLCHIGYYDFNADGTLTLYAPYMMAALLAGAFSGVNPGTPLTNRSLKVRGLERKLRNPTDTDLLIQGGVLCVEETLRGYRVVQSITTWLNDDKYNRVEVSVGVACDFVARNVRNALDVLRGQKANPQTIGQAISITESTLIELARPEPVGPGVLAGDAENPPYRNITAEIDGDVLRVQFECSPVLPVNYVLVTIFAVPYSGSASL